MNKVTFAISWNIKAYIACNGFHPLYAPFVDDELEDLNILDEPEFLQQLSDERYLANVRENVDEFKQQFLKTWSREPVMDKLAKYINLNDLWLTYDIPGSIELHHTSPLTSCLRPFVLHCESFLPIFMPFAYQGVGFNTDIEKVRETYKKVFLSENCLGIYSHLQVTLDQISKFFDDDVINSKLQKTKIGLSRASYSYLTTSTTKRDSTFPTFLFTSSAHQNPASFGLRGGFSSLLFMQKYFNSQRKGRFIFRCSKPKNKDLIKYGINIDLIKQLENEGYLLWINQYLPEIELYNLFIAADIYLLPSVNLHSVSIMQAQAAGAIPIVTDTYGTDLFVEHNITGKVISGVREKVWTIDNDYQIPLDNHNLWGKDEIIDMASEIFQQVTDIIDCPEKLQQLSNNARQYAFENYDGYTFKKEFFESVKSKVKYMVNEKDNILPILNNESKAKKLFNSPPQPVNILSTEQYKLFYLKGTYWVYTLNAFSQKIGSWSTLIDANNGLLKNGDLKVYWELNDAVNELLPLKDVISRNPIAYISEKLRVYSHQFPLLKRILKILFPIVNPIMLRLNNLITRRKIN